MTRRNIDYATEVEERILFEPHDIEGTADEAIEKLTTLLQAIPPAYRHTSFLDGSGDTALMSVTWIRPKSQAELDAKADEERRSESAAAARRRAQYEALRREFEGETK